jgi:2-C-methyl-D-erythritol 4-phosphate cytidylyltransferase
MRSETVNRPVAVILAAAGQSRRFVSAAPPGTEKKTMLSLLGNPVWWYSASLFRCRPDVGQLLIVIAEEDRAIFRQQFGPLMKELDIQTVIGGAERADSIENGLRAITDDCQWVAIHDAARPCIDAGLIERVFAAGKQNRAAIPTIPITSTIKRSDDGQTVSQTVDRTGMFLAQTPQVFEVNLIRELYAGRQGRSVTDESQLAEAHGVPVAMVAGSEYNRKLTTPEDLWLITACLQQRVVSFPESPQPAGSGSDDDDHPLKNCT